MQLRILGSSRQSFRSPINLSECNSSNLIIKVKVNIPHWCASIGSIFSWQWIKVFSSIRSASCFHSPMRLGLFSIIRLFCSKSSYAYTFPPSYLRGPWLKFTRHLSLPSASFYRATSTLSLHSSRQVTDFMMKGAVLHHWAFGPLQSETRIFTLHYCFVHST